MEYIIKKIIIVCLIAAFSIGGAVAATGDSCPIGTECTTTVEICGTNPKQCVCNPDGYVDSSGTCVATDITQAVGNGVTVTTALGVITTKVGTTTLTLKENYATTITTFTLSSTSMTGTITWTGGDNKLQVSATGAVTLKSGYTLDYETEPVVTTVLTAIDATTTTPNTATVSLTLSLTDVKPIFSPAAYTDRVADGATAGTVVTTVTATDADGNTAIAYTITGGNTGGAWGIISTTGVISIATGTTMNRATSPSYSLVVTATDSSTVAKSETVTVYINVATACTADSQCSTASEVCDTVNGFCICKTGYVDNSGTCQTDCPVPTQQNGVIGAGSNSVGSTRTVTCASGYTLTGLATITCKTDSTWETPGTCSETACVTDTDCTQTNNEACTTITGGTKACRCKADYTDNGGTCLSDCPVPTQQNGVIGAGSNSVGSTRTVTCASGYTLTGLATITCKTDSTWKTPGTCSETACTTDNDCTSTNNEACTTLADTTKACRCKADYTDNGGTCLSVATDITQAVGTDVTVTTALGTISNKDGTTTLTLKENYATTITTFTLSSASMTGPFTWIGGNNKLQVSPTGAVTLASTYILDYETELVVTAVLTAKDSATPKNTATVSLTLSLTDVNDNTPIFNPAAYTDRVADGATTGTVTTVTATDADGTTANNVITYSITGGVGAADWSIDGTSGVISVASGKIMASATTPSYNLTVTATDSGTPARLQTVTVFISVATACTSNTDCTTASEQCNTANGANVCKCKAGYVDNSGTCLADCPSVPTQQNGAISPGSNSVGSTRTVTCDSGFVLTGLANITCQTDGTWETPGTCNGAVSMLAGMILLSLSSLVAMVIYI